MVNYVQNVGRNIRSRHANLSYRSGWTRIFELGENIYCKVSRTPSEIARPADIRSGLCDPETCSHAKTREIAKRASRTTSRINWGGC